MNQHIGRYETIEEIGLGGFSRVYKAQDTSLDRLVAIKVMHPVLMSDAGFVTRFQREAKVVAKLQHPNIIPIYDYGEYEGRLFLVMKLMEGSLATRLEEEDPISWDQTVALIQQAAAGLDFAHQQGVIHRDIKPDNVLLDENGNAVLADFGVVKAMEKSTLTISMSGGILGTPAYIAPEVWNDQQITPAVDVYAFGCVLYEMVTGNKLFEASTPPATMAMHFQELQFPSKWPDGVPPGLSDLLSRALAQDPNERFQTAGELAQALTALKLDPLGEQYSSLQTALTQKIWQDAIALAEAILEEDETYKDTSALLGKATKEHLNSQLTLQAAQWSDQAEQAVEAENWEMALTAIRRWQQIAPRDRNAEQLLAQVKTAQSQTSALTSKTTVLSESNKEKQTVPSWVWYITGVVVIILLIFVGNQIFGNGNEPQTVDQSPTFSTVSVLEYETPSKTPTILSTSTRIPQPTNTIKPTATETLTPRSLTLPTNTPRPTSSPTSIPLIEPKVRIVSSANVRSGPGTNYNVIGVLASDTLVDVIAKNESGAWYNIRMDNNSFGWVSAAISEPVEENSLESIAIAVTIPPLQESIATPQQSGPRGILSISPDGQTPCSRSVSVELFGFAPNSRFSNTHKYTYVHCAGWSGESDFTISYIDRVTDSEGHSTWHDTFNVQSVNGTLTFEDEEGNQAIVNLIYEVELTDSSP